MAKIVSNKQNWFNRITLTKDDRLYVGVDVHEKSYAVAVWLNDALAVNFAMPADAQNDELVGTNHERKYLKEKRETFTLAFKKI